MYELTNAITAAFDIKKLKNECNHPGCRNKPEKEFFIYEYSTRRITGIATLYVCAEHLTVARSLMTKLKELKPHIVIMSKEKDISK